ncbi:hypothetical protein CAPTEDRAFT_225103 [Capitella teleta]|uniref:Transporter n=1 Tax=Capitella teleta TaxID=283909 RepID=R7T960_CAPTE|nr:hypothetical protein CAPTEDRAFT_225103 [Capitella teleta]|eukprot:ELT90268.1 hypothetical protein CAPTEDRAFT_225103 [Capitella teleta]
MTKGNGRVEVDHEAEEFGTDFSKDENEDRGNWSGRLDFLLACLGYAVGLGNVWRFPYLCYKNGGAVFFIPYVIMLVFVGIPIFFMELSLGQFTSSGPLTCWECVPIFKGIGVGMVIVSALVGIYYNMIIAWALFYLAASFTSDLPWVTCDRDWAGPYCATFLTDVDLAGCNGTDFVANTTNGVCYNGSEVYGLWNTTLAKENEIKPVLPSEDYLNGYVLGKSYSTGIGDLGPIRWKLVIALFVAWVIVCATLINGVKSSGKVVYFTALFPYIVLIILLIRGLTLDGYKEGIDFYILKLDWDRLKDSAVWKDAAVQIFFSLSDSWGGLIALASYNRFHNDALRDSLIVAIGNCMTSFFAGFVIFSFLGFLAKDLNTTVDDVAESGVGLAFIVYPAAVIRMPVSTLWAILFFMMLITLGLDSEFALVETVTTAFFDQFPVLRKKKWIFMIVMSVLGFLLGLPLTTNGGAYMLQLMDHYAGGWNVLVIAFCECICIAWFYGFARYKEDIRVMIGNSPCCCVPWDFCWWWWSLMWAGVTPLGVLFILGYSWYDYSPASYGKYLYPEWGDALGWLMTIAVIVGIFSTMIVMCICQCHKGKSLYELIKPSPTWGPALPKHRRLMGAYLSPNQFEIDPWGESGNINARSVEMDDVKLEHGGAHNDAYNEKF